MHIDRLKRGDVGKLPSIKQTSLVSIKRDCNKKALTVSFCQLKRIETRRHKQKVFVSEKGF
jgi:hypothetical protein